MNALEVTLHQVGSVLQLIASSVSASEMTVSEAPSELMLSVYVWQQKEHLAYVKPASVIPTCGMGGIMVRRRACIERSRVQCLVRPPLFNDPAQVTHTHLPRHR